MPTDNEHTVYALAWSADDRWLLTGAGDDYEKHGVVKLWDLATGTEAPDMLANLGEGGSTDGPANAVAITADGRGLAAASYYRVYSWWRRD